MALSPPQPLSGQRVLRISGFPHKLKSKTGKLVARKLRVATWNIGTLTGKSRELAEVLKNRRVHVACLQETKWKGSKARDIGEGYKLYYHGESSQKNGVAVVLSADLKTKAVDVKRISDRIMVVKLVLDCGTVNIISAYAPQVGCSDMLKAEFQDLFDDTLRGIPSS